MKLYIIHPVIYVRVVIRRKKMKKWFITVFFSALLICVPCSSAFMLPINNDEINHLETLVQMETDQSTQQILETLLVEIKASDGLLNLTTVEHVLEDQLLQGYPSGNHTVLSSDVWQWIIDRLGWVYITSENVITLSEKGSTIFATISYKTNLAIGWYQSIVQLKETWQLFKDTPTISYLIDFVNAVQSAVTYTITIVNDLLDGEQEIVNSVIEFKNELQNFSTFISSEPWKAPITIYGSVDGIENEATVSCNDETVTTTDNYTLSVPTESMDKPWWIHRCDIQASYESNEKTQTSYAFSLGNIEVDFDFSKDSTILFLPGHHPFIRLIQQYLSGEYSLSEVLQFLYRPISG
jgi:hypothetical protein